MAGKDQSEKQKSKMRLKVNATESEKERAAKERLKQLEKEVQMENAAKSSSSSAFSSSVVEPTLSAAPPVSDAPALVKDEKLRRETAETIFSTHSHSKKLILFWSILLGSIVLSKLPGAEILFTPLNQFTTLVHEMGHAVASILTGGHVSSLTIVADGQGHGGITRSTGIPFIVFQAGYLGTAIFGCFLVWLSQFHKLSKSILVGIGSVIACASVFFIAPGLLSGTVVQSFFSLLWALAMAGAAIYAGLKLKDSKANLVVMFLAIYTAMDSLKAISIIITASLLGATTWSDASNMEQMFILPAFFWAILWATLSAVMLATTVWFTYGVKNVKLPKKLSGSSLTKPKK